jgi:serine/threonine-protein kinase
VDRFEIVRTLSQGGMADLFLARQKTRVGADRLVVVKRLRLKYQDDPDFLSMFVDECRLALRLEHPRIVRAYGIEEWEGSACLVLEYLQGVDASTLIAAGLVGPALGAPAAVTVIHAVADALDHAHRVTGELQEQLGVVHRDISPSNVFVCRDGSVKLIDFGVAAVSRAERKTPRGVLKGKFAYMSPEQCREESLDGRSDIFSLGVVFYELVTGLRPFRAARASQVVRLIIEQTLVPPRALDPTIPAELDALIVRMLAKPREKRPASAGEVCAELEAIAARLGITLARLELTAAMAELIAAEPVPRREPSDTLPDPLADNAAVTVANARLDDPVVLVVDDEESFHAVTRKRLQSYRRISAYSALQALDAVSAHAVDVVLLDLNLPDRSGLEILEELRALGGNLVVIVCTADASVDLAVQCMKRGATDFLVKTHESFAALGSRVESALRKRPTPPAGVGTR